MKRHAIILAAIALVLGSCAKSPETGTNDANKRSFDAWAETHKTDTWRQTPLGSWIMEETPGTGEALGETTSEQAYLCMSYIISDLSGKIESYSEAATAKQMKEYVSYNYYGPQVSLRSTSDMFAGITEIIDQMKVGGHVKAAIPGWLLTSKRYPDAETYLKKGSGTSAIYDITITDKFDNIQEWEKSKIGSQINIAGAETFTDELDGFYYIRTKNSDEPDHEYESSASVYVNYICRRIDGTAVDTNIKDSAKVYGFYSESKTYQPILINWGSKYTDLTMTSNSSSMITGFAYAIFNMKPHEKGRAYFISDYGYQAKGSGKTIPPYCPLIFDLEITDKPE